MKAIPTYLKSAATPLAMLLLAAGAAMTPSHAAAQMPMPAAPATQTQQKTDAAPTQDTQAQITALQQQVVKLQAALKQSHAGKTGSAKGTMSGAKPAMGMGDDSSEMGGMSPDAGKAPMAPMEGEMDQMDAMPPGAAGMKGKAMKPMGCCGMSMGKPMAGASGMADDKMSGMSGGGMAPMKGKGMAAKPMAGASGQEAPHLLHVGAKDFFLDHQQHINMTSDQKMQLEKLKSDAFQQKMSSQTKIDQSEQDLWELTSADQPNSAAIDSKVQEVAKFRADEQMGFIHSVSMASDVLTPDQRAQVVMPMSPANNMKSPMAKKPMTAPMKMQ
jgi:hypothetical protein